MNLQLFADMNTNTTLSPDLSVENKTFYDMTLIDEAGPELVHDQFAQKRPIPKNGGKTIEFRKFCSLEKATKPLTEGVTPDGNTLKAEKIEATVEQFGDYIVQSDMLDLTAIDNTIVEATKVLGRQAGVTLDTITRNVLQSGKNVFYAPKADGTEVTSRTNLDKTCLLTPALIKRAANFLKRNNAPKIDGSYVAIIHPDVALDLQNNDEWIEAHKYAAPENIYEGELGKIGGIRFIESSEAKVYTTDAQGNPLAEGIAVYGCLFMGAGAYGTTEITGGGLETIIKQLGAGEDPLNQRSSIGWKATKTAEILSEPYLLRLECVSSVCDTAIEN